jgi:hypothetical protein
MESLFTGVRGIGILGSSLARFWIRPRNTPALWPWAVPIQARGGGYYLRLDAYAGIWIAAPCRRTSSVFLGTHHNENRENKGDYYGQK